MKYNKPYPSVNRDPLLDTRQAGKHLHKSAGTFVQYRHQGKGPKFAKIGGAVRYRQSDLEFYIAACYEDGEVIE
jgi:predicted DNA-binding transcriptional regulator AlpA